MDPDMPKQTEIQPQRRIESKVPMIPATTNVAAFDRHELMQINNALNLAREHINVPCQSTRRLALDEIACAREVLRAHNALLIH